MKTRACLGILTIALWMGPLSAQQQPDDPFKKAQEELRKRGFQNQWGWGQQWQQGPSQLGGTRNWSTNRGVAVNPNQVSKSILYLPEEKSILADLQKAESLEKEGAWSEAVEIYQRLMEQYSDRILSVSATEEKGGLYAGVKGYCEELLLGTPERLKAYRENFDRLARHHTEIARRDSNFGLLFEIAERFSLTTVGEEVLDWVGTLAYEDGRFEEAFFYWGKLFRLYPESKRLASLLPKCVLATRRMSENPRLLTTLLTMASSSGLAKQEVMINRKKVMLGDYIKEALETVPLATSADYRSLKDYFYPKPYEAVLDASLWRWAVPAGPLVPAVEKDRIAMRFNQTSWVVDLASGKPVVEHAATVEGKGQKPPYLFQNVSLRDGTVYTPLLRYVLTSGLDPRMGNRERTIQNLYGLDAAAGGKVVWDHEGKQYNTKSAPEVTDEFIYSAAEFIESPDSPPEYHVLCFDRKTGKLRWETFLCMNTGGFNTFGAAVVEPMPQILSVYGDTLFVSTNAGIVSALESRTGAIKWVYSYTPLQNTEPVNLFMMPPLMDRGRVVIFPSDAKSVLCLDAASGELKWESEMKRKGQCEGIVNGEVVLTDGRSVTMLDLATGKMLREWVHPQGKDQLPSGKGALSQKFLYLPTPEGLWYVHLQDPSKSGMMHWADGQRDPGTVLLLSEGTLTISVHSLNMFAGEGKRKKSQ